MYVENYPYGYFSKYACISETSARSLILTPWGRKKVYVQLLIFANVQVCSQAERQDSWASFIRIYGLLAHRLMLFSSYYLQA